MLNILGFLLNLVDEYTIWLYAGCLLLVLFYLRSYLIARRARTNTIFSIEKEVAAHSEGRAMSNIGMVLGLVVVITALKYYVVPSVAIEDMVEPTPTMTLPIPTSSTSTTSAVTQTPTPVPPTETPRPRPTRRPTSTPLPPTATPLPKPACPDPNTCIMSPRPHETVSGVLTIRGTANHGRFQFYKVEFGQGQNPTKWHVIGDIVKSQVTNDVLQTFDTTVVPNGTYSLKLTVVDVTGNYPPPHRVPIVIQN